MTIEYPVRIGSNRSNRCSPELQALICNLALTEPRAGISEIWRTITQQGHQVSYFPVFQKVKEAREHGPEIVINPTKEETGWMHGPQKQQVREASVNFAKRFLPKKKIVGNAIGLPYKFHDQTRDYAAVFPHVEGRKLYSYFFENNPLMMHDTVEAHIKSFWRTKTTIVLGDILEEGLRIVPDVQTLVFDLDFMCLVNAAFLSKTLDLVVAKAHSEAFYLFLNNAFGRWTTFHETLAAHRAIVHSIASAWLQKPADKEFDVQYNHQRYRDSFPMLATTLVGFRRKR